MLAGSVPGRIGFSLGMGRIMVGQNLLDSTADVGEEDRLDVM